MGACEHGWMSASLEFLVDLLDLEPIEVNIFRGIQPNEERQRVFGGQVAAQALMAAGRTVEHGRVHSLHSYFLRPGDPKVPILYEVDRIRDGRSFTTRRVVAVQHGRAIFNLSASFHDLEKGLEHQIPMPEVPEPESLTPTMVGPSPPRTVEVDTDLYEATFTAKGARLLSFRLKRYRETVRKDSPLYDVVVQGERLPLGLVVSRGDKIFADQGIDYTTDAPAQVEVSPHADTTVTFTADTKEGLKLTKRFTFRDGSYLYDIDAEVSGAAADGPPDRAKMVEIMRRYGLTPAPPPPQA